MDWINKYLDIIQKQHQNVKEDAASKFSRLDKVVSVTGVISASFLLYKYFSSAAAKECRKEKYSTGQKDICIVKYRLRGIENQIRYLKTNSSKCKKMPSPQTCIKEITDKIDKLKVKKKRAEKSLQTLTKMYKYKFREVT